MPGFGCGVVVFVAAALAAPGTNAFAYSVEYISGKTQRESTAITEMSQERCIGMVRLGRMAAVCVERMLTSWSENWLRPPESNVLVFGVRPKLCENSGGISSYR